MTLPDYSEYLKIPGMLAWIEQEWKVNPHIHDEHARVVNEFINRKDINKVVEVGCGTGELSRRIDGDIFYHGIDSNEECVMYARAKFINDNNKRYTIADIRLFEKGMSHFYDLVISFGFLKHFGLHEWFDIFKRVASFGEYFIFDMPIAYDTKDDGKEFHHVWKSKQEIVDDIEAAGLELLEIVNPSSVEPIFICKRLK